MILQVDEANGFQILNQILRSFNLGSIVKIEYGDHFDSNILGPVKKGTERKFNKSHTALDNNNINNISA